MKNLILGCVLWIFNVAASKQPKIIVALGDSTTAGTPSFLSPREFPPNGRGDEKASYPYWLAKNLPEWAVLNRGVNGERSDQIRTRFQEDVIAVKPRYVVILAGVNDVYQGVPAEITKENLLWMYHQASKSGITPIAASILPFDRATEEQSRRIEDLNRWISNTAKRIGIPFCDLHKTAADPNNPRRLRGSPEGLHPDPATYRLMGEAVGKTIIKLEVHVKMVEDKD